jgi:putative transcriptional regulator
MSEAQIMAAARADPDAQPLTEKQLREMKRVAVVKQIRWKLGLSQEDFAEKFRIPLGTLRDWELHRSEPDQAARAYLKVIAADAKFVARAVMADL